MFLVCYRTPVRARDNPVRTFLLPVVFIYLFVYFQVCYELLCVPVTTPCGHSFCLSCLERLMGKPSQKSK